MLRALVFALLAVAVPHAASVQNVVVLRIKVVLVDSDGKATPVPRHALLVSDNPASAPPRQVVTALDGTAEIKLRPGSYLIESDRPVLFQGKAYQWTEIVEIAAGRDAVLELTADKAEVEAAPATAPATTTTTKTAGSTARVENDPAFLLPQWQDSVVVLWTPTTRATGFVVNALGLVATNNRGIGGATSVEVQLTPSIKVAGSVIAADAARDVAIVWIDPQAIASVRPVPLPCSEATKPTISRGQEIFAIGAPFRRPKGMTPGTAGTAHQHVIASDLLIARGGAGGPVFSASGTLVGITSIAQDKDEGTLGNTPIARIEGACEVVAAAETEMKGGAAPTATHLPVEPTTPFPVDAIKDIVQRRAGSLSPYEMAASAFDVAFITPVLTYGAQYQS
jgi:S1-C subfamily serine protease